MSAVDPASARDDSDTSVTITGTGFADTPTVTLGTTPLTNVIFVGDTTLTATVPGRHHPRRLPAHRRQPRRRQRQPAQRVHRHGGHPHGERRRPPLGGHNDIDTSVTITGADFAATPTVSLGSTPLTNVTLVDSTTLTATVPWGMDPGTYDLTVTNPDGGSGSLPGAFTVTRASASGTPATSSAERCSSSS